MSTPEQAPSELLTLTCTEVVEETPSIRSFRFALPATEVRPGQAMTLNIPHPNGALWRTFSVSGQTGPEEIVMTIKRQAAGGGTDWLHNTLAVGDRIEARRPRGRFTLDLAGQGALAFVSGGSGATPLMAMLQALAARAPERDVVWLHWAHDPQEVLFPARLAALQRDMPNLRVSVAITGPQAGWFGYTGRISRAMVHAMAPDFGRREVFCCGPEGFMTTARLIHAAEGGAKTQFHTESFGNSAPKTSPPNAEVADEAAGPAFRLVANGHALSARANESILQACLRQSVIIPCGCGEGICGTCAVRLVAGRVDMRANGGLSPEEEGEGYILPCSSRATSDLEIRF